MYEDVTYDVILERMLERVSDKFDKREGSVIWDTHSPTAIEFQLLYLELDRVLTESYGDTASREYLILRCAERGITPYEATYAVLQGEFTPSGLSLTGQRFNIGEINYTVLDLISEDGEKSIYRVQCETAGTTGNKYLGATTPIDYIEGLETAELTAVLTPGEDEEDTEDLRQRYFDSLNETAFGGNRADYLSTVNAISGVGSTKVERVWNGDISPADLIPSDTVAEWYNAVISTIDDETAAWLTAVYTAAAEKKLAIGGTVLVTIMNSEYGAASDDLVAAVQEALDPEDTAGEGYGLAPIGHIVCVKSAEEVEITIQTTLTIDSGYSWANLQSAVEAAVEEYLLSLRKEWAEADSLTVRLARMEAAILNVTGISDISGTTLNGVDGNLVLGKYEIPVLGGVEV